MDGGTALAAALLWLLVRVRGRAQAWRSGVKASREEGVPKLAIKARSTGQSVQSPPTAVGGQAPRSEARLEQGGRAWAWTWA
jgi:hypothetical protein